MMKLKVCGMKEEKNILEVAELKPDYMGFILYEKSPRCIHSSIARLVRDLEIKKVGVLVNEDISDIKKHLDMYHFDALQLHGDEDQALTEEIRLNYPDLTIIKAFGVDELFNFNSIKVFEASCDYFLFDTKTREYGGSGKIFDWKLLEDVKSPTPIFLSGGIGAEELFEPFDRQHIFAIDVNSKVEDRPGIKNLKKVKEIRNIIDRWNGTQEL